MNKADDSSPPPAASLCGLDTLRALLAAGKRPPIARDARLRPYTTLQLKVAYHKPLTSETGLVRAEGTVLSLGRRVAFAEAKLTDRAAARLGHLTRCW